MANRNFLDPINGQKCIINWHTTSAGGLAMVMGVSYLEGLYEEGHNLLNLIKQPNGKWKALLTRKVISDPNILEQLLLKAKLGTQGLGPLNTKTGKEVINHGEETN